MSNIITNKTVSQTSGCKTVDIYYTRTEYCCITLEVPVNCTEEDYIEMVSDERAIDKYGHHNLWDIDLHFDSGMDYDHCEEYDEE